MTIKDNLINTLNNLTKQPIKLLTVVICYFIINYFLGGIATLFLGTFILFFVFKFDYRIFIFCGLLFLLTCPLYLMQRKELMAEEMAVYAYYSLFLGISLQLLEFALEKMRRKKVKNSKS